jgi:alkylation response protein AidB-like acyl-CoA dehydrogenase
VDLAVSEREATFRHEVRTWLRENVPRTERPSRGPSLRAFDVEWQHRIYEGGYAGLAWPTEYGGRGLGLLEQLIWHEEYALADGPYNGACFIGLNHAGPTILARGNEDQKRRYLPAILTGAETWGQGFSEPEAGSDLGSIRTRAELDGDEFVVNGHKTWSSFAQYADRQELLVRTDAKAPKHAGLTWMICDLRTPGVTIRPIETMARVPDFAEVFYDDVRIPVGNVVGDVNDGWSVAMSTLAFERGTAFIGEQIELSRVVDRLVDLAGTPVGHHRGQPGDDDAIGERLATARAEVAALRSLTLTSVSLVQRDGQPGAEASLVRLFYSELKQRIFRLAMDILGPQRLELAPVEGNEWVRRYLASFSSTIGAGTAEIQRNLIAERVLGLPRRR